MSTEPTVPADEDTAHASRNEERRSSLAKIRPGDQIGRFRVGRVLGRGGMGLVVAATDDDLDRTVAIKIVRPSGDGSTSPRSRQRLLREARSMARISHPNVITVHEVGTVGDDIFLAMEFVDGGTLDDWIAEADREWSAIVRAWLAAGRGLAAAHSAGLVHRDFKPANVLVSQDERIVVTDFGIAGLVGQLEPASTDSVDTVGSMTQTGALMGTPRYMAPEQHEGARVDARADQFAFCVSLWEAVYREHPFGSGPTASLIAAVIDGKLRAIPQSSAPSGLSRVLRRGLDPQPNRRYPSMDELLADLRRVLNATRRRAWTIGGGLALGGVLALGFVFGRGLDPGASECERAFGGWTGVWDEDVRSRVQTAFTEAKDVAVVRSWSPFEAAVESYVERTDASRAAVCKATERRSSDPRTAAHRTRCLRRSRSSLEALVRLLEARDASVLERGLGAVAELPDPTRCETSLPAAGARDIPAELETAMPELDAEIARAVLLAYSGQAPTAIDILDAQLERVLRAGHLPTEARIRIALAKAHASLDVDRAIRELETAYVQNIEVGDPTEAISAALRIAGLSQEPEAATFWLDLATAHLRRWDLPETWQLWSVRGLVAREANDHETAETWLLRAAEATHLPEDRAATYGNLGSVYAEQRKFDEAREHLTLAIEAATEYYGESHPSVLGLRVNMVVIDTMNGNFERGLHEAEALLEAQREVLVPNHEDLAVTYALLGLALRGVDRYADALVHDEEALRIRTIALGESSEPTLQSMSAVAGDAVVLKQYDRALELSARLLDLARDRFKDQPEAAAPYLIRRGHVLVEVGRLAEAMEVVQELMDDVSSADSRQATEAKIWADATMGHLLLELDRAEEATKYLARADRLGTDENMSPGVRRRLAADLARTKPSEP